MGADIINLRQARKSKSRSQKQQAADANRRKFGRTKAEKAGDKADHEKAERLLEGHRLSGDGDQSEETET